jgi:hypothetical protein
MMQVIAYGAEDDQSRYMVQKVEAHQVMRSLHVWKERGPACGEWIAIPNPETLPLGVERMSEAQCSSPSAPGGNSLPNTQLTDAPRSV